MRRFNPYVVSEKVTASEFAGLVDLYSSLSHVYSSRVIENEPVIENDEVCRAFAVAPFGASIRMLIIKMSAEKVAARWKEAVSCAGGYTQIEESQNVEQAVEEASTDRGDVGHSARDAGPARSFARIGEGISGAA